MIRMNYTSGNAIQHEEVKVFNNYHHFEVSSHEDQKVLCTIDFQKGPIKENGVNGVTERDLLEILKCRLEEFQKSSYKCTYNADALNSIENAIKFLDARTKDRESRSVEGTSKA